MPRKGTDPLYHSFTRSSRSTKSDGKSMNDDGNCTRCKRPLIEIDHYGERLVGWVESLELAR